MPVVERDHHDMTEPIHDLSSEQITRSAADQDHAR